MMTTRIFSAWLLAAALCSAQSPTPAQGRDYSAGVYRVVRVDSQGRLEVVTSGGTAMCTAMTPCIVVGPDADGAPSTASPVQAAGVDINGNVQRNLVDTAGRQQVVGASAAGAAAAGNPVLPGLRDTSGNAQYQAAANRPGDANTGGEIAGVGLFLYDGSTWTRLRGNAQGTFAIGPTGSGSVIDAAANPLVQGVASSGGRARFMFSPNAVAAAGDTGVQSGTFAKLLYNGATWDQEFVCSNQARVNVSGAGNNQIIAASGSTNIRICHLSGTVDGGATLNISFTSGTGANCGTGTATVAGTYDNVSAPAFDFGNMSALRFGAGNAACLNLSGATAFEGVVIYAQF